MKGFDTLKKFLICKGRCSVNSNLIGLVFLSAAMLLVTACGSPPKRPTYGGADSVAQVPPQALVGTWRFSVLNPAVKEENDVESVYTFNSDGSWAATSNTQKASPEFPVFMEATGSWTTSGELFIMKVEEVRETSGSQFGKFMVALMQNSIKKQSGDMNPYSISPDQVVMVSVEEGQAIQLDRIR